MRPRWTIDELLQKDGGRDRAAPASARVFHVRPLAADQLLVLVPLRQSPKALADALSAFNQLPSQLIVVREESRGLAGERHHAGAGEGGVVDDVIGLLLRRVVQRVR